MKTQLKLILTAATIAIGRIFALPASAARGRGGNRNKAVRFNFMPALCAIFIIGMMTACVPSVTLPGDIVESESAYDGTKHRRLEPAFVASVEGGTFDLPAFYLGLYTIDDTQLMIVQLSDYAGIRAVRINIDGKKHEFTTDAFTDFDPGGDGTLGGSRQLFRIPKELIREMVDGKHVIVQVQTPKGVVEGNFSATCGWNTVSSCESFRKFLEKVQQ